jgi:hypothetical protein
MEAAASRGLWESHSIRIRIYIHIPPTRALIWTRLKLARQMGQLFALSTQGLRHSLCRLWPQGSRWATVSSSLVGSAATLVGWCKCKCKRINRDGEVGSGCGLVWGGEVAEADYARLGHCGGIPTRNKGRAARRDSYVDGGEGTQAGPGFKYDYR